MVPPELKLMKKVTADKEGAGPHCQGLWLQERRRLSLEDSTFCLRTLKTDEKIDMDEQSWKLGKGTRRS